MAGRITKERLELLRRVELFQGLDDRELAQIDTLVDDIEVPAGEVLIREGTAGQETYIVLDGEADVLIHGRRVATLGEGATFGEMSMIDFKARTATVVARTEMKLLIIGPSSFATFIGQPGIALGLLRTVVGRLRVAESGPAA